MTITCDSPTTHFDSGCDLLLHYDADGNGVLSAKNYMDAGEDKLAGIITSDELGFIWDTYMLGGIDRMCPGCGTEEEVVTCDGSTTHFASGCELLLHYDTDGDGAIYSSEAGLANGDYNDGLITEAERDFVFDTWHMDSINTMCPECYTDEQYAIFEVVEFTTTPATCSVPCDVDIHIRWQNVGTVVGSFIPTYTVNEVPCIRPQQTLLPYHTYMFDDIVYIDTPGTYEICPYPNE